MHIGFFTNTYYPVISGVVRSVETFRQALTELGHNVFIFAQDASGYQDTHPFIFRYPTLDLPLPVNFPLPIPLSSFVDHLLPHLKMDIIHSHHPFLLGQVAANKATELDTPLVFTFHTQYREYSHYIALSQDFVKETIDRWVTDYIQKCQHLVVPSNSMRQVLADEYGVTERVTTIPTGIDLEPYQRADGPAMRQKLGWGQDKILISVGRLAKEKNWETLLAAVAQVIHKRADVRLVLIGDGSEQETLKNYSEDLGIAAKVNFLGNIPFDDIPSYLKAADLFCFASVTETQGLVTMEAITAGLPVVAVDGTGTKDVIDHGQQGLLTPNDSAAQAQAIEQVLSDDTLRSRFKEAARQKAQSFEMKLQAQKLLDVYRQAWEDKKANLFVPVHREASQIVRLNNQDLRSSEI
jgi:glycosyltransferase involved in cell wall biosynthesis